MNTYINLETLFDNIDWDKDLQKWTLRVDPEDMQSEDAAEVSNGHWIVVNKKQGNETDGFWTERYLQCSECNYERRHAWIRGEYPKYCEDCGSIMDKEN